MEEAQDAVLFGASKVDTVSKIQEMVIVNPEERASAVQMLVKCYNGEETKDGFYTRNNNDLAFYLKVR